MAGLCVLFIYYLKVLTPQWEFLSIAKLSPKPQPKPKRGLRLALILVYPATQSPTPTRESIIQPQRSKIELHFQNKSYVSM